MQNQTETKKVIVEPVIDHEQVKLVRQAKAAKLCHVTPPAITYLIQRGKIQTYQVDGVPLVNLYEVKRAFKMRLADFAKLKNPNLISAQEAAYEYGISSMTIWRWMKKGMLDKYPVANSETFYVVDKRQIEAILLEKDIYW